MRVWQFGHRSTDNSYDCHLCYASGMPNYDPLTFADEICQFYMNELDFPPVAGRMLGYLAVCEPAAQSFNELAEVLLVSRSAIVQAAALLETRGLVKRSRARGERVDKITANIDVAVFEDDLDAVGYTDQAALLRRGAALLPTDDTRQLSLNEIAEFYDFIGTRLPQLKAEWRAQRDAAQRAV